MHGQSEKSEKNNMLAWAVSIQFGILEMEETVGIYSIPFFQRIHASARSQRHPLIPVIESLQLLRYERDIH